MTEQEQPYKEERSVRLERDHLLIAAGVLLVLSGLWLGYFIGHQQGMSVIGASTKDLNKLNTKIDQQQATLDTLTRTLSNTVQERDIALTTSKGLTDTLAKQTADREIQDDRFKAYRDRLLSVGGIELSFQNVQIMKVSPSVFEYHIDLMQLRKKASPSVGALSIRLIQGTNIVNVPLSSSRVDITDFQNFTGRWTMPAGFVPEFMEVSATAGGQSAIQRFAWEGGAQAHPAVVATPSPDVSATKSAS